MVRGLLSICTVCFIWVLSVAQTDIRSYDGSNNNLSNPEYGAVGQQMKRLGGAMYEDGISNPMTRMNPRQISNLLFDQTEDINDGLGLSSYIWVFGQFIDHDITLVPNNNEFIPILLPPDDLLGPFIPFVRSNYDPETGEGAGVPREHFNIISSFIDGSGIYGSDKERAEWLRTMLDGKLKISTGALLPFETRDGEFNSSRDPQAPEMADDIQSGSKLMIAGDVRANENLYLTACHTLFVREHNRLADEIKTKNPAWDDEEIYQHARRMVIGYLQNIAYSEWLPSMGINLPPYQQYDPAINPSISNEFSAAAFRMGHTLINSIVYRMNDDGSEMPQGHLALRDAYFNPLKLVTGGGIEPLFKGMATQIQQDFDCKLVDEVRNFLFGNPGYGGLDLAAINIFRGRERGIPDFNTLRKSVGLAPYETFGEITDDTNVVILLEEIYKSVNNIDAWVGLLSENHMNSSLFGETVNKILFDQFLELRDGDRFYFEIDPGLNVEEIQLITNTRLSDIIKRNTSIELMQENVFIATPHTEIPESRVIVAERHLDMVVYPSPFESNLTFKVYAKYGGTSEVILINAFGQEVSTYYQELVTGENDFNMNVNSKLSSGLYYVQLKMGDRITNRRLIKG